MRIINLSDELNEDGTYRHRVDTSFISAVSSIPFDNNTEGTFGIYVDCRYKFMSGSRWGRNEVYYKDEETRDSELERLRIEFGKRFCP